MDTKKIEELINVLEHSRAEELTVKKGDVRVHVRKGTKPKAALKPRSATVKSVDTGARVDQAPLTKTVLAPKVGIFHSSDLLAVSGAKISVGQIVGSIESMKLQNEVLSDVAGTLVKFLVEDGMPVEYGQPLCEIKPEGV